MTFENYLQVRTMPLKSSLVTSVREAFDKSYSGFSTLPKELLLLPGMSGKKYRTFINTLVSNLDSPRYLEIGCCAGSTFCSAIYNNSVSALAIDNWSEYNGPKEEFFSNVNKFKSSHSEVDFIESDYKDVNFERLGRAARFNVYFFDGPHTEQDQYNGVILAQPALEDTFVLIVDDWNWSQVRSGTLRAIRDLGLSLLFGLEIRTSLDNSHGEPFGQWSDWHNGYLISVYQKKQ